MPTRITTNLESAFLRFGSDPPVKIKDVVCYADEPTEDGVYVGFDIGSLCSESYSFTAQLTSKQFKRITSLVGRGNNWRRMHGKKLLRIPLKERRSKNG